MDYGDPICAADTCDGRLDRLDEITFVVGLDEMGEGECAV